MRWVSLVVLVVGRGEGREVVGVVLEGLGGVLRTVGGLGGVLLLRVVRGLVCVGSGRDGVVMGLVVSLRVAVVLVSARRLVGGEVRRSGVSVRVYDDAVVSGLVGGGIARHVRALLRQVGGHVLSGALRVRSALRL